MKGNDDSGMVREFMDMVGIQSILDMEGVTEIAINRPGEMWFEDGDGWHVIEAPGATYTNLEHLVMAMGVYSHLPYTLGPEKPIASVVLPGGQRGQIIVPPGTENGCIALSIRKPSLQRFSIQDYIHSGRFSRVNVAAPMFGGLTDRQKELYALSRGQGADIGEFLKKAVDDRLNFLIVGGTGSGKTTVAKAVADLFPAHRRYVTIEDVHEMDLPNHPNHIHLFFKRGGVSAREIIEASMRLKPDHIFLAELRGDEAWSYLEALNTGHEGSITTIHANDTYSSFARLATLIKQSDVGLTIDMPLIMETIKKSIDVILFFNKTYLTEIYYEPALKNRLLSAGFEDDPDEK